MGYCYSNSSFPREVIITNKKLYSKITVRFFDTFCKKKIELSLTNVDHCAHKVSGQDRTELMGGIRWSKGAGMSCADICTEVATPPGVRVCSPSQRNSTMNSNRSGKRVGKYLVYYLPPHAFRSFEITC